MKQVKDIIMQYLLENGIVGCNLNEYAFSGDFLHGRSNNIGIQIISRNYYKPRWRGGHRDSERNQLYSDIFKCINENRDFIIKDIIDKTNKEHCSIKFENNTNTYAVIIVTIY